MDVVGPRANGEIMALAKQASADWVFGSDDTPEWREMRKFHSEQLKDEALRLCGVDEAGKTPSTCNVGYEDTDLPAAAAPEELLDSTVAAAKKVPDESVDLVVAQAIDAVALAPVELPADPARLSGQADIDAARAMLAQENALYYGLGLALAYADDGLRGRIRVLREASHERVSVLTTLVDDPRLPGDVGAGAGAEDGAEDAAAEDAAAEALVPAAGYKFTEGFQEPTSLPEATHLVKTMQSDLVKQWRRTAADASSADWMRAAILLAAHAQRA
ncbi:hypothetical protein A0K93_07970 [Corynebacterium sp. BCW_4722]|nr:hypothetical protein A0K93_07970 [Corynebacterium sp. BCW_4722]